MLIGHTVRKIQDILQNIVKEMKKKGQNINCKKTECMVVRNEEKKRPECELQIGNAKISQVHKFKYQGSILIKGENATAKSEGTLG